MATRNVTPVNLTPAAPVPNILDFAAGPGGFLWGASQLNIVRIDPVSGAVTLFPLPANMSGTGFGGAFTYINGDIGFARNSPGAIFRVRITNPASASPTITLIPSTGPASTAPSVASLDATSCVRPPQPSRAAVVASSVNWALSDAIPATVATNTFTWGDRPLTPMMGDWDGDGLKTVGYFRYGVLYLNNQNDNSPPEHTFNFFGDARGYTIAGDYDGNGFDDIAVFRCGRWEIQYLDANGPIPAAAGGTARFTLPLPFSQACTWPAGAPVAGDWDGDGRDGIGTYDLTSGRWVLKNVADGVGGRDYDFVFWGAPVAAPAPRPATRWSETGTAMATTRRATESARSDTTSTPCRSMAT